MQNKLIPMIATDVGLATIRAFYVDELGWEVAFDVDDYLQVRHGPDEADPELAFTTPVGAAELGHEVDAYAGGLVVSIPVADVDAHHEALARTNVSPATTPSDKPWGWRSYLVVDPAGVILDFCRELEPAGDVGAETATAATHA